MGACPNSSRRSASVRPSVNGLRQLAADCTAMSKTEIGLVYGTVPGIGGAIGTIAGGYLADSWARRTAAGSSGFRCGASSSARRCSSPRCSRRTPELSLLLYFPAIGLAAMYLGPAVAITHHLVPPAMRAMSSAVLFFILNMLGLGLGPTALGALSDWFRVNAGAEGMSLQWAMAAVVIAMYPLSLLWHLGARALPKGELDDEGNAAQPATA